MAKHPPAAQPPVRDRNIFSEPASKLVPKHFPSREGKEGGERGIIAGYNCA